MGNRFRDRFEGGPTPLSPTHHRPDDHIRDDIHEQLSRRSHIDVEAIGIDVRHGHVLLTGRVHHRRLKLEIEDVADGCMGVTAVDNQIRVQRGLAPSGRMSANPQH